MQCVLETATIDWEEHGEGRPILFLHGWTMNRRLEIADYEPIFAARRGWRRIYLDLPGMGQSVAHAIKSQDDMLAALLAFIDKVLPGQRFVLAGTSLGSYLARGIAANLRSRVDGLMLRVPCIVPDTAKRTLPPADGLGQMPGYVAASEPKMRDLVQPAIDASAPFVSEMRLDPKRYAFSFDLAAAEKSFAKPVLIVAGRQDTTVGYRDAWDILECYPRATFAVLDRADHVWPVEQPNLLAALVDDWLARIAKSEQSI
jgi:pimeloyl-ACP methyl ester carboxylesterase